MHRARRDLKREDRIVIVDSVTALDESAAGRIAVCGSHAGLLVGRLALAIGVSGLVANDAGVGKEEAGIAALEILAQSDVPAVAVDAGSARIGDGTDTYRRGVASTVNAPARKIGITVDFSARRAADLMARRPADFAIPPPRPDKPNITRVSAGPPPIFAIDSASWISDEHKGAIVVTGSHGGIVSGRAVKSAVGAAVFNDAGVGRDRAGVSRLAVLDEQGIPGMTVGNSSARIGDAMDTYESGVITHVNRNASAMGVQVGDSTRSALRCLQDALSERSTQWR